MVAAQSHDDRWAIGYQDRAAGSFDRLGDSTAARYRHFRRFIEGYKDIDYALFGLLLSAESVRDEILAYERQTSALLKLAQTGHVVRQLQRLHRILDSASMTNPIDEPRMFKEWEVALAQERRDRVDAYNDALKRLESAREAESTGMLEEIESEEQQEEAMTLLKAALGKYENDVLTNDEVVVLKTAFWVIANRCGAVVMTLPSWFAAPFEFGSTFGLSRWGNDVLVPEQMSQERFIKEAATWSTLNHPHIAKFLGACHVGSRCFVAHEKTRSLTNYALQVKDNTKEIWQRLHEVALGLQYLHERGIQIGPLTLSSIACAQFEDKAILLGAHLDALGSEHPDSTPTIKKAKRGDHEALALLAVKLLRETRSPHSMLHMLVDPMSGNSGSSGATNFNNDWDEMPTSRPEFVNEHEWDLLSNLAMKKNDSIESILRVFRHLSNTPKADGRHVHWIDEIDVAADETSKSKKVDPDSSFEREEAEVMSAFMKSRYAGTYTSSTKTLSNESFDWSDEEAAPQPASDKLPVWFIPSSEVNFRSFEAFSAGSFGSVHLGKWFDTPVVVKRAFVDQGTRKQVQAQFCREADVWFQLNHINVVKMYGACHVQDLFFVCEHAKGGELSSYLENKEHNMHLVWYSLLNAALGLQYLHESGIIHGDLKGNNILVGTDDVVKLADFGLSTRANSEEANEVVGAFRWKAPERLSGEPATFASDVYSFAMCIIEIVTGSVPWGSSIPDAAVRFHVKRGRLPSRPPELADAEWRLIERMCCTDPAKRVTIDAVVAHLSSIIEDLTIKEVLTTPADELSMRTFDDRVIARGGALVSLLSLMRSRNERLRSLANAHLLAVKVNRGSSPNREEVEAIIGLLGSPNDSEMTWAVDAVRNIAWENKENAMMVVSAGGVDPLLKLMRTGYGSLKHGAAAAIGSLARHDACRSMIVKNGGIDLAVSLLQNGDDDEKTSAIIALCNLLVDTEPEALTGVANAVKPLIEMVQNGGEIHKEYGSVALWYLSVFGKCTAHIASAGAIKPLVNLVQNGNSKQREYAMNILAFLAQDSENSALIASYGGIKPLVKSLCDGSDEEKTSAQNLLCNLSKEAQGIAVLAGVVPALVTLLRDGNEKHKEIAAAALSFLYQRDEHKSLIDSADCVAPLLELAKKGTNKQKENALAALAKLMESAKNCASLVAGGGLQVLILAIRNGKDIDKVNAVIALHLVLLHTDDKNWEGVGDVIEPLVTLIRNGDGEMKKCAANALGYMATKEKGREFIEFSKANELVDLVLIGDNQQRQEAAKVLTVLAQLGGEKSLGALGVDADMLMAQAKGDTIWKKGASTLLSIAALCESRKSAMVAAGIIELFAEMARNGDAEDHKNMVRAWWGLSSDALGRTKIIAAGGVEQLMLMVKDEDDQLEEWILGTMWILALNDKNVVAKLVTLGAVPIFLEFVATGTNSQRLLAAGVLGFLDADLTTKRRVAEQGGIMALLSALGSAADSVAEDILVALRSLCAGGDRSIKSSFEAANAMEVLSKVSESGNKKLQLLASEVLGELASI